MLTESIGSLDVLSPAQQKELLGFLEKHHAAFALEEHESVHRNGCPSQFREEVARQLDRMQAAGVIQLSSWCVKRMAPTVFASTINNSTL